MKRMHISISECKEKDIPELMKIRFEAFSSSILYNLSTDFSEIFFSALKSNPNTFFIVAKQKDETVGYLIGTLDNFILRFSPFFILKTTVILSSSLLRRKISASRLSRKVLNSLALRVHRDGLPDDNGGKAELFEIALKESFRRKEIGTRMIRSFFEIAEAKDAKVIYTLVDAENDKAIAFYEKNGFRKVKELTYLKRTHVMVNRYFKCEKRFSVPQK